MRMPIFLLGRALPDIICLRIAVIILSVGVIVQANATLLNILIHRKEKIKENTFCITHQLSIMKKREIFGGRYRKTGNSIATVFSYKIYSDGIISYDNNQSGTYLLESSDIRFPLAWEMYYAALGQVPGSMKYRTVEGISKELQLHYKCFKWHIPFIYDNAEFAEMGSVNKKARRAMMVIVGFLRLSLGFVDIWRELFGT